MPAPFLLVSFRFPPYDRIGAYRWTKLCGRLAKLGHSIDVMSVHWPGAEDPGWFQDVSHPNIRIHRTPSGYPHALRNLRPDGRVVQRVHGTAFKLFDALTPTHDVASLWGRFLLPRARPLLEPYGSKVVIATGGPFNSNYWAARLCDDPRQALIQDFRDPWLDTQQELETSPWAPRFEFATRRADVLVSVNDEMSELFQRLTQHPCVETVPNGVEFSKLRAKATEREPSYDFVYIGGLFNEREVPLRRFLGWVREKQQHGKAPRVAIAGLYANALPEDFRDLTESGQLEFKSHLPQDEAFALLAASRIGLQFNGPVPSAYYQTTTKVAEHAALRRPTLSLNYGGATEKLLRSKKLGFSVRADSDDLFDQLDACWRSDHQFEFDVFEFDFDNTAAQYSRLIDSLSGR